MNPEIEPKVFSVDFDGTLSHHEFPGIGDEVPYAIAVCRALQRHGHRLILFTMRSDVKDPKSTDPEICKLSGDFLTDAVAWCKDRGLEFWGVNENPEQSAWTKSNKVYAHGYIDDAALGTPLLELHKKRPVVDWRGIARILMVRDHLPNDFMKTFDTLDPYAGETYRTLPRRQSLQ